MDRPGASFRAAAEAAQVGAGIIAARHRGDRAAAKSLTEGLSAAGQAAGFLLLADLAVMRLASREGCSVDEVTEDLKRQIAAQVANL